MYLKRLPYLSVYLKRRLAPQSCPPAAAGTAIELRYGGQIWEKHREFFAASRPGRRSGERGDKAKAFAAGSGRGGQYPESLRLPCASADDWRASLAFYIALGVSLRGDPIINVLQPLIGPHTEKQ